MKNTTMNELENQSIYLCIIVYSKLPFTIISSSLILINVGHWYFY